MLHGLSRRVGGGTRRLIIRLEKWGKTCFGSRGTAVAVGQAMTQTMVSFPRLFGSLAFMALVGTVPVARAGDVSSVRIAAATPDGKHAAIFNVTNGYPNGTGALVSLDRAPRYEDLQKPLANATCPVKNEKVTPYARWTWDKHVPKLAELVVFADPNDDQSAGQRARIVVDRDTRLARLEVLKDDRWWPVKAMPGVDKLTGTALLPGGLLIRTNYPGNQGSDWDEINVVKDEEVRRTEERWLRARSEAAAATAALRKLRAEGARPFTHRPRGAGDAQAWDYRRAKALDPVIEKWAIGAAFAPLTAADLGDMIWLLDARDAPGQKLVALRLVAGLRERDPKAADTLLADLEQDPDTADLVPLLRADHDPLRRLPDPTLRALTKADLVPLTNDDLLWLHRMVRAQGRFRFSDPALVDYFSLFSFYNPVSTKTWQKLTVDKFFLKDPDKSALSYRTSTLLAILEVEKERGLEKPAL